MPFLASQVSDAQRWAIGLRICGRLREYGRGSGFDSSARPLARPECQNGEETQREHSGQQRVLTGAWLHGHVFIKDLDRTAVGILSPGANAIDSPKRLSPSLRHDERSVASRPTAGSVDSGAELSIRDISAFTLPLTALPRLTRADAGVVRVGRRRPDR